MLPPTGRRLSAPRRRRPVALLVIISLLTLAAPLPQRFASIIPVAHAASPDVVISQVYGGGGNSGATYQSDFVELFNRGASAVSLGGLSVQYASATGTGNFSGNPIVTLSGSLAPGQYYLVRLGGGATGVPLPTPDAAQTGLNLAAGGGKVALVSGTAGLACNGGPTACSASDQARIIDLLGYGSANFFEGSPAAGPSGNATGVLRAAGGCTDTDNNAANFSVAPLNPRNTSSPLSPCGTATAPSITAQPQSQSVTSGQTATLSVTAGGTAPLTYQWYQGAAPNTGAPVGANSPSFTTPALTATTGYWVRVTNGAGTADSVTAVVTVTEPTPTPTPTPSPTPSPTPVPGGAIVISQVYGGGGNANAVYKNDYIEIFNRSSETVTLNNWSVQFAQATASAWSVTPFTATLAPGQYFLIRQAAGTSCSGAACGQDLPAFDAAGTIGVGSTSGKVALVSNSAALTSSCPAGGAVVDFIGYGAVNCSEGDDATAGDNAGSGLSNTTAAYRAGDGCTDTNSNAADFTAAPPAPRHAGSPTKNCADVPPPTGEVNSTVVISQVYAGGGNSNAVYTHDFVELYNRGTSAVSLTGWSLQYASATGAGWDSNRQPLGGTIAPGEYYLVGLGSGGANGSPLPPANVAGEVNLSATAGKVALVRSFDGLSGNCPLSDASLADFVGYGSTADCGEGNKKASSPGSANSLHRSNGGLADTNNNQADFQTGAPGPRRTSPVVELGPFVFGTDPRTNSTTAPRDASITVNFTEPVQVAGQWFDVRCATSGAHNSAAVTGGPKAFTITPNVSFVNNELCTLTVFQGAVSDLDADDSQPGTDNLPADYTWSFRTSDGAPPPFPHSVHLAMGNPTGAAADLGAPNNYLMEKPEFALSYNRDKGAANWVSWHLSSEWIGGLARVDSFRPDPAVPADWYRVLGTDYSGSGFDRGHMVPNADRDHQDSLPVNQATFLMTNILPQSPDNNQGPWAAQENYFRTLLPSSEIYIVAGGVGQGGAGSAGFANSIAGGKVHVPSHTWKVALVIPRGDDDLSRVTCGARAIAVLMPNVQGIRNESWESYLVSVDRIEALTGYDFFSNLPDAVESCVEAGVNGANPPGTENQAVSTDEDTAAAFTLNAAPANANPLAYEVLTQPAHGTLAGAGADRTYTPAPNFSGSDSFTFRVRDGALNSNTATVSITVHSVNDAPSAVSDAAATDEDTAVVVDVLANDTDAEGEALTVTAAGNGVNGSAEVVGGQVVFTPATDYHGPASFTYTVGDAGGAMATGTVSVTVNPVNDAPVLSGVPASTNIDELSPYSFTAAASDVDAPAQPLVFSLVNAPAGASIDSATGRFTWTPTEAQGGTGAPYSFKVRVSDGSAEAEAFITLTVAEANRAPRLAPVGGKVVPLGGTLTFAAAGADDDAPAQRLSYSLTGAVPAGAVIDADSGAFRWTPSPQQVGAVHTFWVRVTDDGAGNLFAQEQVSVGVAYNWSGLLQPINPGGDSVFRRGSTVSVKFALTGQSAGITGAAARLWVARLSGDVAGTEAEAESTAAATPGNLFRYDPSAGQYVFNLDTKSLAGGTYQLRVDMGDGAVRVVNISLRD